MPDLNFMTAVDAMRISEASFDLDYGQEFTQQASGIVRVRDVRSPIWKISFSAPSRTLAEVEAVKALLDELRGSALSFYAWCPSRQYPLTDPTGSIVGASNVQINALNVSDLTRMSLKGLPAAYILTRGDFLAFDYTATTSRRALHRVVSATVTANGSGVTPEFVVAPPLRAGAAVDAVVNIKRAAGEFRVTPKSFKAPASGVTASVSFDAVQVI
jgi:hypothetical protein